MKLIAGLGNPGQEYVYTRHNMGWAAIDLLADRMSLGRPSAKFRGEAWTGRGLVLLKPMTFMNLSGLAVREAFDFYKMTPEDVLVICDDMALPYGHLRLRAKGSAGGHNGLISVISCLGTLEVPRLRIGIGHSPSGPGKGQIGWVLGHLSGEEMREFPSVMAAAADAVEAWLTQGVERAMNQVNKKSASETPAPSPESRQNQ